MTPAERVARLDAINPHGGEILIQKGLLATALADDVERLERERLALIVDVNHAVAENNRIADRLRALVHGADDVTADTAIDSLTVMTMRRRVLQAERDWARQVATELAADVDMRKPINQRFAKEIASWEK